MDGFSLLVKWVLTVITILLIALILLSYFSVNFIVITVGGWQAVGEILLAIGILFLVWGE